MSAVDSATCWGRHKGAHEGRAERESMDKEEERAPWR